ncbi:ABC transporter permease [Planotetraspora kaengkrachanensis]|uniref:ABC3 transporter permease C-terminal domain-containing protein n=1 Tax=Planotetraspora kaengkrachanensis TaxID=575193 RepID=A0A8J3V9A1_9ACTN|nr:ABC transporter permease [Planotetraspora kaengkrachanensis]GIG82004.1 hypothetical protein Pka01_51310 [Planotetraspora kaengkrachanensis]
MSAFRVALRISRRNAWRAKRRSALILTMIAIPVLVATCLVTILDAYVSSDGPLDRRPLGRADVRLWGSPEWTHVSQDRRGNSERQESAGDARPFTEAEITGMFGPGSRTVRIDEGPLRYLTPQGYTSEYVGQADLRDPLFQGTYRLVDGRLPDAPGQVVISRDALRRGVKIGQTLFAGPGRAPLRVVGAGLLWPTSGPQASFIAFPGTLPAGLLRGPETTVSWLVDTQKPVSWADVRSLNLRGAMAVSRAVPDESAPGDQSHVDGETVLYAVPWIAMMLLEVILLAGAAFAVGQRRRTGEFALLGVQGGSPRQLRTVALADGLLFGVSASVIGAAAGIVVAAVGLPRFEDFYGKLAGTFTVPWAIVAVIVAMGTAAGLLASLAPAQRASRTNPVAVLTGRRVPGRDRAGRPVLGLVLIVMGLTATVFAASHGVSRVVAAALLTQLGLIAALPWLITRVSRLAGMLPFTLRFAVRDAARNRGRTVPAVAAVMIAVTLLTGWGVAWRSVLSDVPDRPLGYSLGPAGGWWVRGDELGTELWGRVRASVRAALPAGVPITEVKSVVSGSDEQVFANILMPETSSGEGRISTGAAEPVSPEELLIGDERLLHYVLGRDDPAAVSALREGKAVVLDPAAVRDGKVEIDLLKAGESSSDKGPALILPAIGVRASTRTYADVVVAPETVTKHGYTTATSYLVVDPADFRMTPDMARRLMTDLRALTPQVTGQLEAPQTPDDTPILALLGPAAAVLVLGMSFVATALAAAEARPDLAVMSAVGAAPRTRRAVKAGQALVVALVGTIVGVVAGLVPGVAVRWALANPPGSASTVGGIRAMYHALPMIVVPWSLIALLVVGLPLLAALVCAVFTRSTLPAPRRRPA